MGQKIFSLLSKQWSGSRKKRKTFLSDVWNLRALKSHSQKQFFHNGLANNTNRLRLSLSLHLNLIFLIPLFNLNNHARGKQKKNCFFFSSRISPSTWTAIDIRCGLIVLCLYWRRFYKSASISRRCFARSIKSNPDHRTGKKTFPSESCANKASRFA